MPELELELRDRLLEAIQAKKWQQVDEAWLQVLEREPLGLHVHEQIAQRILRKKQVEKLGELYSALINQHLARNEMAQTLSIIEMLLALEPVLEFVRKPLMECLRSIHAARGEAKLNEFFLVSGLDGELPDVRKSYQKFDELAGAAVGQVFQHQSWGLGVVRQLDPAGAKVVIDFELKKGQSMTLDGVRQFLRRIPGDHLLARMAVAPAELKALCTEEPAAVVRLALKSFGGRMKAADLKKVLTTRFLTEAEHRKWWEVARLAIKTDPLVELVGTGTHAELILRKEPRSFAEVVADKMRAARSTAEVRECLREVSRLGSDADMSEADVAKIFDIFSFPARTGIATPPDQLNYALLFEEFSGIFTGMENPYPIKSLLEAVEPEQLTRDVTVPDLRRTALEKLIELRPEGWADFFVEVFPHLDPKAAAWAEREMRNRGEDDLRQRGLESILARPERNPDLFLWATRNIFEGNWRTTAESVPLPMLMEEVLALLAEAYETSTMPDASPDKVAPAKALVSKIRSFVQEDHSKFMRSAVKAATAEEARRLLHQVHMHSALLDAFKSNMEYLIYADHPTLKKVSKAEEEEERKKPTYHYALAESVDRKRTELSRILSVEIPESTKAIAAARELGDLKENAEYHAAKDRQKLLMQTAAELEELIARARIVEPSQVTTNVSRFGTKLTIRRRDTGVVESFTLLGMWEADLPQNVISYLTPLGQQLLNRRREDVFTVVFPDGREAEYEVMDIVRAI